MAVSGFGRGYKLTSTGVLNQATVGVAQHPGPFTTRVNAIHLVVGSSPTTVTTIRAGGASGTILFNAVPTADATTVISFSTPQDIDDLAVSAISSNTEVIVLIV